VVLVRLEIRDELFPATLPEEAGSGDGRDRQQADTEDANNNLLGGVVANNLMTEARGKFLASPAQRIRHERGRDR